MESAKEEFYIHFITAKRRLQQFDEPGLNGEEKIYFIPYEGIKAAASRVFISGFDQEKAQVKVEETESLEPRVLAHERVVRKATRTQTIIPLKFGTIFKSEEQVRKMLEEDYQKFKFLLEKLERKQEWAVKIYCDLEVMKEKIKKTNPKISELEVEMSAKSPATAYWIKKKRGQLIKKEVDEKVLRYSSQIYKRLKNWAEDVFIGDLLGEELFKRKKMEMILNAAYLVGVKKRNKFFREFENLKKDFLNQGLEWEFYGPLPPYNFVNFHRDRNGRKNRY